MEHRFNYFQQNPNALVNGQSTTFDHRRSSLMDGTRATDTNSGNMMSSMSSQDQSQFHERKHTNPNAAPPTSSYPLYQTDSTNQPPRSSGPPRTNVKGIYENPQSSIPNVLNLAQSNAENYPINPDFQLQPHLTNLLPQQPNRVPELYPVDKYSNNRGSIAANMNTNYFSSNKSYPEPKIIEYDMEETSTESSPQHTSSVYSESTDQDSENIIHPGNAFSRHTLNKNTECHVAQELKPIASSNLDLNFPVPSQFADLNLNRDDCVDDQQSILHSAYNQDDDDDIIEDIPLTDNINQNEIETNLENQENPESMFNNQSSNMSGTQTFDYYSNKKDFEFNYENKQGSSSIFNNKINYSHYNVTSSSNIQNSSQFNKEPYFSHSSTMIQTGLSNSTISQSSQSKPLFPYSNTEQFNCQQVSPNTQNFDVTQSVFSNSNVPQVDSKLQSNIVDFNIQDKKDLNQSTPHSQISNNQSNCPSVDSTKTSLYDFKNLPTNQQLMFSSSKLPVSELANNKHSTNNQPFTAYNSLLMSSQSADPTTSAVTTTRCSPFVSEAIVQQNENTPYQVTDNQDGIFSSNKVSKTGQSNLINQDSKDNLKSEFDNSLSLSSSYKLVENQQDFNQSDKQSNQSLLDNVKPASSSSVTNLTHSNHFYNSNNINYQQMPTNNFIPQQSVTDDNCKATCNQVSNNLVSHIINNQNATVQQSALSQSTGNYFDPPNSNIQSVFNQQLPNLQSHSQQQNVCAQNLKPISSFPPSDNSDNIATFSNLQNTANQKSLLLQNELEMTENVNTDSNTLSGETLNSMVSSNSVGSVLNESKSINDGSIENTEPKTFNSQQTFDNYTPNDQFSNMTIDNKQNVPVSQTFNQDTSASYFSKETSLKKEDKSILFQNLSSTEDPKNPSVKLPDVSNTPQSLVNNQPNSPSLNADQLTAHQNLPMPICNQTVPDESNVQQEVNPLPPQQFDNKLIPNAVSPVSAAINQSSQQVLNNQPKSDNVSYLQTSSSYSTQPLNNQQLSNTIPSVFPTSNQQISNTVPSVFSSSQQISNTVPSVFSNQFTTQTLSNEPKLNAVSSSQLISNSFNSQTTKSTITSVPSAVNRVPPQMFTNQPKLDILSSSQPISNLFSAQTFNSQPALSTPVNQFNSQIHNNQPKLGDMPPPRPTLVNQYPSNSLNNQSLASTFPPTLSDTNQFSPQVFNGQAKLEMMPTLQPAVKKYPDQMFSSQSTQNTLPPVSSAVNQLQPQLFGNQSKSSILQPIQPAASQYPAQSFNNEPKSSMVPPVPSMANQLNHQVMNNKSKSDVPPFQSASSQYPSQPLINQPPLPTMFPPVSSTSNQFPPVSSTSNQFPPQMLSNQPRLDGGLSNKPTASRYPPQPLSNQILSGPPIQQATNQYPTQQFNNQSKPNTFPLPQAVPNQYSSLPLNSQLGQQNLPKLNQPPPGNQFYPQTAHNQGQPHQSMNQSAPPLSNNFPNQTSAMFSQPTPVTNLSSNLQPNVNQQTQRVNSQILPPNALSSNNYYNQVQGNVNVQQSQPPAVVPGQNIQLASKGYPQQSNTGFSGQQNYQQPNAIHGQGILSQQQSPYGIEQNPSVVQQGFAKTWGYDNLDLLKTRDVLPGDGVQPPEIKLPQGYANCDNCSPDIFRCTLNKFPSSKNLLDKSRLPLGILIHPYKDLSRLTVIQCETITRCRNCRSYINPFVQFTDNAHWKCNLCYRLNELPAEFQIDPYTKTLGDPSRRPEIQNATIEYIASQDYMVRPPQPALYLFLLDVSRVATLTGYLEIVCDRILNKIMADDIPGDSRTNIGFITYDSAVHFYQIANSDGGQPKQLIVSDISDIFLPLPDGLMVNLEENKSAIKDLLTSLPNFYKESYNTGCALGAALEAAFKILAPRGGRVTVFQACLPNCGPGSLQPRDDGNPHTGERVQHMAPSTDYYKKLALECSAEQIAVDMFFISSQYLDIATISGISKYSAGCTHNFPQFDVKSPTIVTRFINCFDRYLSRKIGFEALLRLRCTRGVAIHSFHGNFFVRSSDLLMLPNVNPDNAYGMQLSIEESLDGVSVVCFQAALLYTSSNAERRIRVHTLCIPVTDNLNDVFHNADQQAIACLIAKMAVDRSTEKSLSDAREAFFNAISDSLSAFKLGCSSYNGPGTMLSPLSLKVFPLYILATLKHAAFRTNQPTRLDERMYSMCQMKNLPLSTLVQYIYPDLYPIHTLEEQPKIDYEKLTEIPLPPVIQLSAERVESNGIYLMDDSETLTIFIGHKCSDQLIQKLFGFVNVHSMPELTITLTEVDSKPSYLLRSFISYLQHFKPYPLPIEIIKDNGPHKLRFYSRLVEDKFESSLSYYEFLQRISQQVR